MKIEKTSNLDTLINSNPFFYKDYDILIMTKKCLNECEKVKIKRDKYDDTDKAIDEYYRTMDLVLSTLPRRKFLLMNDDSRVIFEYDFNGVMFSVKTHFFAGEFEVVYRFIYIRGLRMSKMEFISGDGHIVSELNIFAKEHSFSSVESWAHYIVTDLVLKEIIFIELSKEMVRYKTIYPKSKMGQVMSGNYVNNLSKHKLVLVDSLWYTKMIGVGSFQVSGHFRLQPCGVGFSQVKLIYIEQYQKTHYIRKSTREMTFGESVLH